MISVSRTFALTALAAAVLAGCGGSDYSAPLVSQPAPAAPAAPVAPVEPPPPPPPAVTKLVELRTTQLPIQSIVFHKGAAYLSLFNSAKDGTSVLKAGLPLVSTTSWAPTNLGKCVLPPTTESINFDRAPSLKSVDGKLWLFQQYMGSDKNEEHHLCEANDDGTAFLPKDAGLKTCNEFFCDVPWITDLKLVGTRLLSNAGGGENVLLSEDKGSTWKVLNGSFGSMACYHPSFEVIGDRLLVGGECPLDSAYLRSYQLTADGSKLASATPLSMDLPDLQNRNIQFIESVAGTKRVFVGVEGGLLRSDDSGKSFKFVIHEEIMSENKSYPYIWKFLSPAGKPDVLIVAGFDKVARKPYLAWSANGGDTWTNLSSMLPQPANSDLTGQVTALAEGPNGEILVTVNDALDGKGHLLQLTLGKP